MLEKNSILLLNEIIYRIYTVRDFDEMRRSVLEFLQYLIPSTISTFYLASSESPYHLERPVGLGVSDERLQLYLDQYFEVDYTRWTFAAPKSNVYRETDLLRDETRTKTPYYRMLFEQEKVHYSVIVTLIYDGVFLGTIDLFRPREYGDFTDDEIFFLDMLKAHLNFRLYQIMENNTLREKTYPSKEDLVEAYHLTPRELEIVYLLLDGISKAQICEQLCISPNTLKKHTLNLYKKLGIKSWRELFSLLK